MYGILSILLVIAGLVMVGTGWGELRRGYRTGPLKLTFGLLMLFASAVIALDHEPARNHALEDPSYDPNASTP